MFVAPLPNIVLDPVVRLALTEDLGRSGDLTSEAVIDPEARVTATVRTRQTGIAAGYDAAGRVMALVDQALVWSEKTPEGQALVPGQDLLEVTGPAQSVFAAERTLLNFLNLLSGTATLTAGYAERIAGTKARLTATRKTIPGLRALQIRAVRLGGGVSHRTGLDDAILVKDNHIGVAGGIVEAFTRARGAAGHMRKVAVEVDTLKQLAEVLPLDPDSVLLDNMAPEMLAQAVAMVSGRCVVEASGGVTLDTVGAIALAGVDYISVGALTHSAPALDIGLDMN